MVSETVLTGIERSIIDNELIVTKTDLRGCIVYANTVFISISGYSEDELLGQPHNCIRHPHMPRAVFRLLWDTVHSGNEFFGYVMNLSKNGDHYWVFAHITPNFDSSRAIIGYHSSRRFARRKAIDAVVPIYQRLLEEEQRYDTKEQGLKSSMQLLQDFIQRSGNDTYTRFVLSL